MFIIGEINPMTLSRSRIKIWSKTALHWIISFPASKLFVEGFDDIGWAKFDKSLVNDLIGAEYGGDEILKGFLSNFAWNSSWKILADSE